MESNSVCNHTSDYQNQSTAWQESYLLITSTITDRIGQHEVLLPINHNYKKICDILGSFLIIKTQEILRVFFFFARSEKKPFQPARWCVLSC